MAGYQSENTKHTIPKLNTKNYSHWKLMTEMVLLKEGLWDTTIESQPEDPSPEWRKMDNAARATITLSLEESQIPIIRGCTTANQVWMKIKKDKEFACLSTKRNIRRKLNSAKMNTGETMEQYINNITESAYQLREIGETIEDDQIVSIILGGVPEEYDPLITALETLSINDLNLDYIKAKLMEEYLRKESRNTETQKNNAYFSYKNKTQRRCYICNSPQHIKRNCPQLNRSSAREYQEYKQTDEDEYRKRSYYSENKERDNTTDKQGETDQNTDKTFMAFTAISTSTDPPIESENSTWILDTGANAHMTNDKKLFQNLTKCTYTQTVKLANGKELEIKGKGNCRMLQTNFPEQPGIELKDTLYVPELKANLISVGQILEKGYTIKFDRKECSILNNQEIICQGTINQGIFSIELKPIENQTAYSECVHQWHRILGHRSITDIKILSKHEYTNNMTISSCECNDECTACIQGSLTRLPYKPSNNQSYNKAFQHLSSDLCGPIHPNSLGNGKYFMTISDRFTKFVTSYILHSKSEAPNRIMEFINQNQNHFGYLPEAIKTDGGGEYDNHKLNSYLQEKGIVHEKTIPYCPQQNGTSERLNRTLLNMTRSMLCEKQLPKHLWGEGIITATYLYNLMVHHTTKKVPYTEWKKSRPKMDHLHIFGSTIYYYTEKSTRNKFDPIADKGIFVGYCIGQAGYRVWIPESNKIISARNVKFSEEKLAIQNLIPDDIHTPLEENYIDLDYVPAEEQEAPADPPVAIRRSTRSTRGIPPLRLIAEQT